MSDSNSFAGAQLTERDGQANPLLKAAVESANDAVIITEALLELPGPRIEYVNPAFTRMTGYTAEEALGKTPRMLQGPQTDRALLRTLRDDLLHRRSFHGETINYRKDGTPYHVEWRITPLFDENGEVAKWVAIQRDVTSRFQDQQERERLLASERAARAEAERQSRMKDEFLAMVSHELRTPLNAIIGWAQILLQDRIEDPSIAEGLAVIARNGKAQAELIDDLLEMSRIITGKIRLHRQPVRLEVLVKGALATIEPDVNRKSLRLEEEIPTACAPIEGDPARLQQVVSNLLTNAVKFTPAGGTIRVSLVEQEDALQLSISDTGRGIKREFLEHVFDRFRQEDSSITRRQGGLGLGLSIVKNLVELHDGRIEVYSDGEGKGARFTVTIPLARPSEARSDADQADDTAFPTDQELESLRGLRVLVVVDVAYARNLTRRILARSGAEVVTAASATEGWAAIEQTPPQLIISDIGMPEIDGYAFISEIRKRPAQAGGAVLAIAATAFARAEDRRRALVAGFDAHVAKPIDPAELIAVLGRIMTRTGGRQ
ncbi:MAG: PAS domain-containing hybrid sensor histidine kinase/response regulator [Tepidisphaeraceae bacterium]